MKDLFVIVPNKNISPMLSEMIREVTSYTNYTLVQDANNIPSLQNKNGLFQSFVSRIRAPRPEAKF